MKIAILTQPLQTNYGGLLQAFALQKALEKLGFDSEIIIYSFTYIHFKWYGRKNLRTTFDFYTKFLLGQPTHIQDWPRFTIGNIFRKFINKHIKHTELCPLQKMGHISSDYGRWIVGSDQVWRLAYIKDLGAPSFFLNFLKEEQRNRSFSYAASFGTDQWEGTEEETKSWIPLLKQFQAVSVREHSGIDICRDTFGIGAVQMPDPTLLLNIEDYEAIISGEQTSHPEQPYIASYILDFSESIQNLLTGMGKEMELPIQHLSPQPMGKHIRDRLPISVAQWLSYIKNAKYMITDSFHGCVFSIIFHIPFVCLGNQDRGSARFHSLLKTFGLEDRMISKDNSAHIQKVLLTAVDWEQIQHTHQKERKKGLDFLKGNCS